MASRLLRNERRVSLVILSQEMPGKQIDFKSRLNWNATVRTLLGLARQ